MAKLRGGSVFSTEKRRGKLRFAFRFCGTHYPSRAAMPDAAHISHLDQPRDPKPRLSSAARHPEPCKLRVVQNDHLQARQFRVACNIQSKAQGIVPGGSERVASAAAPADKANPAPPFLRRKDSAPSPSTPPAASNTPGSPNRQTCQLYPKATKQRTKKQDPIQP